MRLTLPCASTAMHQWVNSFTVYIISPTPLLRLTDEKMRARDLHKMESCDIENAFF